MRVCNIEQCNRIHKAYGYCELHWKRIKNHGDPFYLKPGPTIIHKVCKVCNKEFNTDKGKAIWNTTCGNSECVTTAKKTFGPKHTEEFKRKLSKARMAENNPNWSGDKVQVGGVHTWVKNRLSKPSKCPSCKRSVKLDLANISLTINPDTYTRDLKNWEWLCRKCHMTKDGRIYTFYKNRKKKHDASPAL